MRQHKIDPRYQAYIALHQSPILTDWPAIEGKVEGQTETKSNPLSHILIVRCHFDGLCHLKINKKYKLLDVVDALLTMTSGRLELIRI